MSTTRRWLSAVAAVVLFVFCCGASGYVGVCIGYFLGETQGSLRDAPMHAADVTNDLRLLRKGSADLVVESLESELDVLISRSAAYDESLYAKYGWVSDSVTGDSQEDRRDRKRKFMSVVSKYRKEFPSPMKNDAVRAHLEAELARFPPMECRSLDAGAPSN